jgi:hypothetical protein
MGLRALIGRARRRLTGSETAAAPPAQRLELHEQRYADGVRYFEKGKLDKALAAFTEFLSIVGRASWAASETPPYALPSIHGYSDFERAFSRLLEEAFRRWDALHEPFPRFLKVVNSEGAAGNSIAGRRLLFLLPQYIRNSKRFIEADFRDHLLESAANAGAEVDIFHTDRCSYPGAGFDAGLAQSELDLLAAKVGSFRPDVVVIDGNYVPSAESLNPSYLRELKSKHGFKLIVFIGDAWGSHWVPAADSWGEVSDVIFHFAPETPLEEEGRFPEKLCWSAYPVNERNFYPDDSKELDVSFVGTYVSRMRPFWLTIALQVAKQLKLKHRLLPHRREAQVALTMDKYATVLRQSKMVLNFSTRLEPLKMMTGRTWQAMASGVVLLEEENVFIAAYFVPFVHYIPFSNRNELAYTMRFFALHPEWASRVGAAASKFCKEHYSSAAIWSRLIDAAYAGSSPKQHL